MAVTTSVFGLGLPAPARAADEGADGMWPAVRASLFGDRAIREPADEILRLRVPARAADAAVVPLAISLGAPQTPEHYVTALYVVIDRNPSPIAAVFRFTPSSGRADVETRVRIEDYTHVRAIAEFNTGELYAATRYVKAAGGCSAPAAKTDDVAALGRMRLAVDPPTAPGEPFVGRLSIRHPNHSGLAMDQLSRHYTPAWYVRTIELTYDGQALMTADVDFSLSENPSLRFRFVPRGPGLLKARVVDTKELHFETALEVPTGTQEAVPVAPGREAP